MIDEALAAVRGWRADEREAALATVVRVEGSAPRGVGAKLAVAAGGEMAGSVSGGCVEGDVVEHALAVLASGDPVVRRYGISDEQGLDVGLMCGGTIEVLVEPVEGMRAGLIELFTALVESGRPAAREIAVAGAGPLGTDRVLDGQAAVDATDTVERVHDRILPPPRVWIVGAGHVAEHVAAYAARAGFLPLVVDPRRLFAEQPRFDGVAVIADWPDRAFAEHGLRADDAVVVLSHDPKIDEPALLAALGTDVAYVGAIGSRRAQEDRRARLRAAGLAEDRLARLHAPIGLDLGGREPPEIGLAIVAELVANRHGREGGPMRDATRGA
jgi:xanthine dehydrogenase accessory factor